MKKLLLFALTIMCLQLSAQTRGYSNIDNVGQQAFSILQKIPTSTLDQFSANFSDNIYLFENITGQKIPSNYLSTMYDDLRKKVLCPV